MLFNSTRNKNQTVKFSDAVLNCFPQDGGVYVPAEIEDLRRWISYINKNTSFTSIAGTLTSAMIKDEFSPIICETIATNAFTFEPVVKQLDDNLFIMELYHGQTGDFREFGISYLCSYLETTFQLTGKKALFLDYTDGLLGKLMAKSLRGKKNIKAVLVYQEGTVQGLEEQDFIWNGGNILPIEMSIPPEQIKSLIDQIFQDSDFVQENNLTIANTSNVCRLLSQVSFFPYSFSRIKDKVDGDIYYALDAGNYGTLMAGLYSWRFALPVSGFFLPASPNLFIDSDGNPIIKDTISNPNQNASSMNPANLERLDSFFEQNKLMMRNFVHPSPVTTQTMMEATKELYKKYGIIADPETARAFAAVKNNLTDLIDEESAIVLVDYNHPAFAKEYCQNVLGITPKLPNYIEQFQTNVKLNKKTISTIEELKEKIKSLNS
jgi:threonine synthase